VYPHIHTDLDPAVVLDIATKVGWNGDSVHNDLVIDKILDLMTQTLTTVGVMARILVEGQEFRGVVV